MTFTVAWTARYWHKGTDSNIGANQNFTTGLPLGSSNNIGSVTYHDLNVNYVLNENTSVNFVVNNLFDKQPPFFGQGHSQGSTGINTYPEAYDVTGRYYSVSATFKF